MTIDSMKIKEDIINDVNKSDIIKKMNTTFLHKIMTDYLKYEEDLKCVKEHIWIASFNDKEIILNIDTICFDKSNIPEELISKVFRSSIKREATYAILIHNYLNKKIEIQESDKDLARIIYQCGHILKILVDDYIIMNEKDFISFKYTGIMENIKNSSKNVPSIELVNDLKQEYEEIKNNTFEEGRLKSRIEIAKKMKALGIDIDTIKEATMLSEKEIEKILKDG